MKSKVLFLIAGIITGVLIMFLVGQRYELHVSERHPYAFQLDRWTGKTISFTFADVRHKPDSPSKKEDYSDLNLDTKEGLAKAFDRAFDLD